MAAVKNTKANQNSLRKIHCNFEVLLTLNSVPLFVLRQHVKIFVTRDKTPCIVAERNKGAGFDTIKNIPRNLDVLSKN
jgi:hypothetical protein